MKSWRTFIERLTPGIPYPLLIVSVNSAVFLLLDHYFSTENFFKKTLRPAFDIDPGLLFGYAPYAWFVLSTFTLFFLMTLLVARLIDGNGPADVGCALGDWRKGLKWTGIFFLAMIPIVVAASFIPAFSKFYPMAKTAGDSPAAFILFEFLMLLYFIAWEFFFRGYMLFSMHKHIGNAAILVQMIPFALVHGGKPLPEAVGAIFVGILLGYFALATRTFLYCALLHFLVAFSMDIAALAQKSELFH